MTFYERLQNLPGIPKNYRFPIYAFVLGFAVFALIVGLIVLSRMNSITKSVNDTLSALESVDPAVQKTADETNAQAEAAKQLMIAVIATAISMVFGLPFGILFSVSASSY